MEGQYVFASDGRTYKIFDPEGRELKDVRGIIWWTDDLIDVLTEKASLVNIPVKFRALKKADGKQPRPRGVRS